MLKKVMAAIIISGLLGAGVAATVFNSIEDSSVKFDKTAIKGAVAEYYASTQSLPIDNKDIFDYNEPDVDTIISRLQEHFTDVEISEKFAVVSKKKLIQNSSLYGTVSDGEYVLMKDNPGIVISVSDEDLSWILDSIGNGIDLSNASVYWKDLPDITTVTHVSVDGNDIYISGDGINRVSKGSSDYDIIIESVVLPDVYDRILYYINSSRESYMIEEGGSEEIK